MADKKERKEKQYLEYENGKVKEVEDKEAEMREEFEKLIDEDESLSTIADYLKDFDEIEKANEEESIEEVNNAKKSDKQYIDLKEHKYVDGDEESDSWIKEEKQDNKTKKAKKESDFHFYISSYHFFLLIMVACVVCFMYLQKNPISSKPVEVIQPEETQQAQEPVNTFDPEIEELIEISRISTSYLDMVKVLSEYRDSETKGLKDYMEGNDSKENVKNLASQAAIQKQEYLDGLEREKISAEFVNLNSAMQRVVRAELNASKKIIRDIETSQKPIDIYTSFTNTNGAINSHITKMCNELEKKLKKYSISYYRSGNSFKF